MQLMAAVESRRLVGATLSLTNTQMRRGYRSPRSESANIRLSSSSIRAHDSINRERQVCSHLPRGAASHKAASPNKRETAEAILSHWDVIESGNICLTASSGS